MQSDHATRDSPPLKLVEFPDGKYSVPMGAILGGQLINRAYQTLRSTNPDAAARVHMAYNQRLQEDGKEPVWESIIEDWMDDEKSFDMDAVDNYLAE